MKIFITLMMCVWLLASCQESNKEAMLRLVNEWNGKEIKFPSCSVFTIQGKDTVDFPYKGTDYKVVTYVDSVGCVSCNLQLHRWKEWVEEVDSLTDGAVPFLFYFQTKDLKELRYLTRREGFTYPVCFDEKDELDALNQFPDEMMFQTFLLDKDNKVVAIGNPVLSPKVKELYLKVMTGKGVQETTKGLTEVSLDQTVLDFGSFPKEEKQERSFVLTNIGTNILVIHDVITSCGCTQVEYRKEPARPGDTLELKVSYEAEDKGFFNKTLTVYCNTRNSPLRLMIRGSAK